MKRLNNLYEKVYAIDNLVLADGNARKGKAMQYGVKLHSLHQEDNILKLHELLKNKTYCTSPYSTFKIYDPKERDIYRLPYYPDRIAHHAIMNVLKPIFVSTFTADTYSCIEGRGIHAASINLRKALQDASNTTYYLQLDIKKFYPSINHTILKQLLRKKIKDEDMLWLLDEIINSTPGVPIGNYLSQYFANYYLTYFDHWVKQTLGVYAYFRYADDMIILSSSKEKLHQYRAAIKKYLFEQLNLEIKSNYRVAPVEHQGINFVGYIHYHTHTKLRKRIKQRFARMLHHRPSKASIASYNGWAVHANTTQLLNKLYGSI